jgi:signal peptide peptidase SppA
MDKILTMPSLWAILPEQIGITQHAFMAYLKRCLGPEAQALTPKANLLDVDIREMPSTFFMDGNIAIMQIEGLITPTADIFSRLFGGSTIDVMTRDFKSLVSDDNVKAIVLDIDSPGGVVHGAQEFANLVFEARDVKPIIAISGTIMASLAMYIGAAAETIFITEETVVTGSISAIINHIDISGFEKEIGMITTQVATGKFKTISSPFAPLTEEGRAELQSHVDHVTNVFVTDIAKFRGVDIDTVNSNMSDGKIFVGSQGIDAGLIDGIISPDELIERINASV